ncbi:hypothetical protein [Winogradskyella tangerina]|uniref:hypothetical protein n=1 Tax=Winogradskyella tangerina TaxID=2023240 RepID=UPI000DBE34F4|nr:hypothetical protein [Winogradskyella tangerina]
MRNKKKLLDDIGSIIDSLNSEKSGNYLSVLRCLYNYYQNFNESVEIENYSITNSHHYLSIKNKGDEFFSFLELSKDYIEFRFPEHSEFFVFNKDFLTNIEVNLDIFLRNFTH